MFSFVSSGARIAGEWRKRDAAFHLVKANSGGGLHQKFSRIFHHGWTPMGTDEGKAFSGGVRHSVRFPESNRFAAAQRDGSL
jgi:hypothetical protein